MILTASAIKLSQPGLSNLERFLGSAAIICSTASIISTAIAHFHSEADVERTVVYVDGESPEMLLVGFIFSSLLAFLLRNSKDEERCDVFTTDFPFLCARY